MSKDSYLHQAHGPELGAPLIFAFHGTGGDETQFFAFARQIYAAAGVVAPRGDVVEANGAHRFFKRSGEGIYDMQDLPQRVETMADFIASYAAEHPGSAVYGLGYSNGANILSAVVMAHPELFDRVAFMHPLIPWEPLPVAGLADRAVLITAGRNDPICPLPQTERLVDWYKAQGARVETLIHEGGHDIALQEYRVVRAFLTPATPDNVAQ